MKHDDYILTPNEPCGCNDRFRGDVYLKVKNCLSEFVTEVQKSEARKNLGIPDKWTMKWGNIGGFLEELTDLMEYLDNLKLNLSIPEELIEQIFRDYINSPEFNSIIENVVLNFLDDYLENNLTMEQIMQAVRDYIDSLNIGDLINLYLEGDEFKELIQNYIGENLDKDALLKEVQDYINSLDLSSLIQNAILNYIDNLDLTELIKQSIADYIDSLDLSLQITEAINKYFEDLDVSDLVSNIVNSYLEGDEFKTNLNNLLNTWLNNNLDPEEIRQMVEDYINNLNVNELINNAVNSWFEENLQSIIDNNINPYIDLKIKEEMDRIREELTQWCNDIERVVANALIRHEQWILEHSESL